MNRQIPSEDRYTDAPADIAEEIRASVPIADDFPSPEELRRELTRSVTIRLDPDVYNWFKLPGPGYQTRINAVLRHYMKLYQTAAKPSGQLVKRGTGMRLVAAKAAPKASGKRVRLVAAAVRRSAKKEAHPAKAKRKRRARV